MAEGYHDNFGSANNNYGTHNSEQAFMQPGASGGSNGGRTVIDFDLSSIPVGGIIQSLSLDLFGYGLSSNYGQAVPIGHLGINKCLL